MTLGKAHRHSRDFSEHALERTIRQVALLAHATDNSATGGPAFKALFPDGLDAELRPIGPSQVASAVALRERLDTQPAAAKVKAQVMDDFDKALCLCSHRPSHCSPI